MSGLSQTRVVAPAKQSSTPVHTDLQQRKYDEHNKELFDLQRNSTNQIEPAAPPIVHEVLRSPGEPLDMKTRAFMEPRFGHDFSKVRVHTDAKAAESTLKVDALAYTVGRDVVFGMGKYTPHSLSGWHLLAHELAHVAQQQRGLNQGRLQVGMQPLKATLKPELEACEASVNAISGRTFAVSSAIPFGTIQHAAADGNDAESYEIRFKFGTAYMHWQGLNFDKTLQILWSIRFRLFEDIKTGISRQSMIHERYLEQPVVAWLSANASGSSPPGVNIWDPAFPHLELATVALKKRSLMEAKDHLVNASNAVYEAHQAITRFEEGSIKGAERIVFGLEVTKVISAVAVTVATGGLARHASLSLLGSSAAIGVVGGTYGATQEFSGQATERVIGTRQTIDWSTIRRRFTVDTITNFIGSYAGGMLVKYITKYFGSYLSNVSDDLLIELGGPQGPLHRDAFVTAGQKFFADFIAGIGIAPLTATVNAIISRATGGEGPKTIEDFAEMIAHYMATGATFQIFLGAFTHHYTKFAMSGGSAGGKKHTTTAKPAKSGESIKPSSGEPITLPKKPMSPQLPEPARVPEPVKEVASAKEPELPSVSEHAKPPTLAPTPEPLAVPSKPVATPTEPAAMPSKPMATLSEPIAGVPSRGVVAEGGSTGGLRMRSVTEVRPGGQVVVRQELVFEQPQAVEGPKSMGVKAPQGPTPEGDQATSPFQGYASRPLRFSGERPPSVASLSATPTAPLPWNAASKNMPLPSMRYFPDLFIYHFPGAQSQGEWIKEPPQSEGEEIKLPPQSEGEEIKLPPQSEGEEIKLPPQSQGVEYFELGAAINKPRLQRLDNMSKIEQRQAWDEAYKQYLEGRHVLEVAVNGKSVLLSVSGSGGAEGHTEYAVIEYLLENKMLKPKDMLLLQGIFAPCPFHSDKCGMCSDVMALVSLDLDVDIVYSTSALRLDLNKKENSAERGGRYYEAGKGFRSRGEKAYRPRPKINHTLKKILDLIRCIKAEKKGV